MDFAHVKGIGGPGAPHCFRLERVADAGTFHRFTLILFSNCPTMSNVFYDGIIMGARDTPFINFPSTSPILFLHCDVDTDCDYVVKS